MEQGGLLLLLLVLVFVLVLVLETHANRPCQDSCDTIK